MPQAKRSVVQKGLMGIAAIYMLAWTALYECHRLHKGGWAHLGTGRALLLPGLRTKGSRRAHEQGLLRQPRRTLVPDLCEQHKTRLTHAHIRTA
jgi:hypothetical protein